MRLPQAVVESIVRECGADAWHVWGICQHEQHLEAAAAMRWIYRNIRRDQRIFETGCGCGANLLWLAQRGFRRLSGADLSQPAVEAARRLAERAGAKIEAWCDDSIVPARIPECDVLIAIDWSYLRGVNFDLGVFLSLYRNHLASDGVVLFDMVDASFNQMADNAFNTDDWSLPIEQRRPTQYQLRLSRTQVHAAASATGFAVIETLSGSQIPPRLVYVLKKLSK